MTFLPIVERELRVGARRRYTWWSRAGAAGFALAIFGLLYLLALATKGMVFAKGQEQFAVLKWLAFIAACAAGVFLTSDSLSEEKREGTLGLLFLTDLRGYDVVLGKLISSSVQVFYGFLAAFPVIALALLLGGVTGFEFWRAMLLICNGLFVSICMGLAVSSVSRDAIKAMNAALLGSVALLLGPQLFDLALAGFDPAFFRPILSFISPAYSFYTAGIFLPPHYWSSLALQHALGWGLLAWASFCTPRSWQEKAANPNRAQPALAERWRFGAGSARVALRRRLLGKNPVLWLVLRDRWLRRLLWIVVLASAVEMAWMVTHRDEFKPTVITPAKSAAAATKPTNGAMVTATPTRTVITPAMAVLFSSLQFLLMFGVSLWVASQAARFFVEALRNGALELVLVTPVGPREIVQAQKTALLRTFVLPVVSLLLMQIANGVISIVEMWSAGGAGSPGFDLVFFQIINLVCGVVTFVTGLLALGWFGMWMGLTSRKTTAAVLKTYCFVSVLPAIALMFVQGLVMGVTAFSGRLHIIWLGTVVAAVLHVIKDLVFIIWSRRNLLLDFRDTVAQAGRALVPPAMPMPPIVAIAPAAPPSPV